MPNLMRQGKGDGGFRTLCSVAYKYNGAVCSKWVPFRAKLRISISVHSVSCQNGLQERILSMRFLSSTQIVFGIAGRRLRKADQKRLQKHRALTCGVCADYCCSSFTPSRNLCPQPTTSLQVALTGWMPQCAPQS